MSYSVRGCLRIALHVVFGVSLETILLRQSDDDTIPPGTIPRVVERLIEEVESRGLTEVGICA